MTRPASVIAAIYVIAFVIAYKLYTANVRTAWLSWADQSRYLASARAFAIFDLTPTAHWYPLLYSLAVSPLTFLPPWLAFGIIDLGCLLIAFNGFSRVAGHFGVRHWTACAIFAATTLLYPTILDQWLNPWTTTLSAALIWQALAATFSIIRSSNVTPLAAVRLGLLLALIPLARPSDLIISCIVALPILISLRSNIRVFLVAAGTSVTTLILYTILHILIYGLNVSPYMELSTEFGLYFGNIGWKAFVILIDPSSWFPDGHGLIQHCPWLLVGAAGILAALLGDTNHRWMVFIIATVMAAYTIVMLAYVDLLPSGLWRYNNVHYFKWMLPAFGLFTMMFVRDAQEHLLVSAAAMATVLALSALRFVPVGAAEGAPARLILFSHPERDFPKIYMAETAIADRVGMMRSFYSYHQVPNGKGLVYAIALRRDFSDREQWLGTAPKGTSWPQSAPKPGRAVAADLAGPWPRRPLARFREQLAWGIPCWWFTNPCRADFRVPT